MLVSTSDGVREPVVSSRKASPGLDPPVKHGYGCERYGNNNPNPKLAGHADF